MNRIADDRIDAWADARAHGAGLILAVMHGQRPGMADLDRDQVEDVAVHLAVRLAALAGDLYGHEVAVRRAAEDLAEARKLLSALRTPAPDTVPAEWTGEPMDLCLTWSVRLAPPTGRCGGCTGPLPAGPPWLVDQLCRTAYCDGCGERAGYPALVDRIRSARVALIGASDARAVEVIHALDDDRVP